jgi:hypothetical protein
MNDELICSICLEELKKEFVTYSCNHPFHQACINEWIRNHNTCPLCRGKIQQQSRLSPELEERLRRRYHHRALENYAHIDARDYNYFNLVQPWYNAEPQNQENTYLYSFALEPGNEPSNSSGFNFSRIDNIDLSQVEQNIIQVSGGALGFMLQ